MVFCGRSLLLSLTTSLSVPSNSRMASWDEVKIFANTARDRIVTNEHGDVISVPTIMNYVTAETNAPFTRRDVSGSDGGIEGCTWDSVETNIFNGRLHELTLDQNGFQLTRSDLPPDLDFYNQKDVVEKYYPLCEELLKQTLGGKVQVLAFDHNVRSNSDRRDIENGNGAVVQEPLGIVHADYTLVSAPKRLEQLAQPPKANDIHRQFLKEGETLIDPETVQQVSNGKRRFAMANVWRNISREAPVLQRPLGCVDAKTTQLEKLRTFSIHYADRVGENYFVVNDPEQRWYYFPMMTHHEAILLKQWDSYGNLAQGDLSDSSSYLSTFAVHSAFLDPSSPDDAPPRESIEVRCVIVYPLEEEDGDETNEK